jgi:hypothetical protein
MRTVRCSKCLQYKPPTEFAKNKNRKNGLQSRCNSCRHDYNTSDEVRRHNRDKMLRRKFGITLKQFEAMLEAQDGKCAICKQTELSLSNQRLEKTLAVDHDHQTGKNRKLLCQRCNIGIGHLDTIELLQAAIEYLQEHNETATAIS